MHVCVLPDGHALHAAVWVGVAYPVQGAAPPDEDEEVDVPPLEDDVDVPPLEDDVEEEDDDDELVVSAGGVGAAGFFAVDVVAGVSDAGSVGL